MRSKGSSNFFYLQFILAVGHLRMLDVLFISKQKVIYQIIEANSIPWINLIFLLRNIYLNTRLNIIKYAYVIIISYNTYKEKNIILILKKCWWHVIWCLFWINWLVLTISASSDCLNAWIIKIILDEKFIALLLHND